MPDESPFWKLANPSTLPTGNGFGVAFSPNGTILAVVHPTSPYISVYPWNINTGFGSKFANPSTLPAGGGDRVTFSPDGTMIAVSDLNSPFISVYPWNNTTGFGAKFANPSTLPTATPVFMAFSPDGTILAVASTTSPYISVYPWSNSTGFGNKFANPSTLPVGGAWGVAFSPDGTMIAAAHANSPFISVYPWNNSTGFGNKFANPSTLPGGSGVQAAFSPDGTVIALAHGTTPFVSVYPWNNSTGFGTKFANPSTLPAGSGEQVAFRPDGKMIAISHDVSPFISTYPWSNSTGFGTKFNDPLTLPTGTAWGVSLTSNSMAVSHNTTPFVTAYVYQQAPAASSGDSTGAFNKNVGFKGVNVRQTGDRIVFRESLKDSSGTPVTTGTTTLRIYELELDGTLATYDFASNTFKTAVASLPTASMTHQTSNNGTVNTGIWTYALTNLYGFTLGNIYIYSVNNNAATPPNIEREFQFGGQEGDLLVTAGSIAPGQAYLQTDVTRLGGSSAAGTNLSNFYSAFETGTATGGASSSMTLRSGANGINDYYKAQVIFILSGTGAGQTNQITGYDGTTKIATVKTSWATQPDATSTYLILSRIG